ncbi:Lipid-A-disaccharide synthase [bacterium HR33]|nr:Lipid-A-disaccharide synthase [bacterium HR33]
MRSSAPRIYLSAGEASGDIHAAALAEALREACPEAVLEGMGGPAMAASGVRLFATIDRCQAAGLVELLGSVPTHWRLLKEAEKWLVERGYDLAVLVDYPGFHLRLLRAAIARGIPVLYYIAPQLWAWGSWRAKILRSPLVKIASILPFEPGELGRLGLQAQFVGHPLLDRPAPPTREVARKELGLGSRGPVIALLPGSRPAEIKRIWPAMRDAAQRLRRRHPGAEVVVAGLGEHRYPGSEGFCVRRDDVALVLAAADAALCKAGTATLEAALAGVPHAVVQRVHPVTYAVARRVVRVPYIGLVNLVLEEAIVPELIQSGARPEALERILEILLDPGSPERARQLEAFAMLRPRLGTPGVAARVAHIALKQIGALATETQPAFS